MQREIKFRGKRVDGGGWVYGYYVADPLGKHRIYLQPFPEATLNTYFFVIPETVGQFTGLKDMKGVDIYEGDIIKLLEYGDVYTPVLFKNGAFCIHGFNWDAKRCLVIGNIHDNPQLPVKK